MKKILYILLAAAVISFAGCRATPENEVVIQKDTEQMIQTAAGTGDAGRIGNMDIPARFESHIASASGRVTVDADAVIVPLSTESLPVARVAAAQFSQETVDAFFRVFLADAVMYDAQKPKTKTDIEQELIDLRRDLIEDPSMEPQLAPLIASLEEAYDAAPESVEDSVSDGKLRLMERGLPAVGVPAMVRYQGIHVAEKGADEQQVRSLRVQNDSDMQEPVRQEYSDGTYSINPVNKGASLTYRDNRHGRCDGLYQYIRRVTGEDAVDGMAYGHLALTPIEAWEKAESLLMQLDVPMAVTDVWLLGDGRMDEARAFIEPPTAFAYEIRCTSRAAGAPCVYLPMSMEIPGDDYGETWGSWAYEHMEIRMDDTGVFSLTWDAPLAVVDTVVDDAQLLSFDEIKRIFDKMMLVTYEYYEGGNPIKDMKISVDHVYIGLQRIAEKDSRDKGLLVPVWSFCGKTTTTYTHPDIKPETTDFNILSMPLLTINAIDGTVIDSSLGY